MSENKNNDKSNNTNNGTSSSSDGSGGCSNGSNTSLIKSHEKKFEILRSMFREYYFRYNKIIESPKDIKEREFGYQYFGSDRNVSGMIRHLSFRNVGELVATLIREVPSDFYCSNGYYKFPTYPMQEKNWLGADLIFDIDAKDLHLPCQSNHSYFICESCTNAGPRKEIVADRCVSCNSQNLSFLSIPCDKCICKLKNEVKRLLNILIDDFGIEEKALQTYFSGNNGFHIHVMDSNFQYLDARARSDITAYILGNGIMPESIGVSKKVSRTVKRSIYDNALAGRVYQTIRSNNNEDDFVIKYPKSGFMCGWRKRLTDQLRVSELSASKLKNIVQQKGGYYSFKTELDKLAKELGVKIDPQVTMDVHRVFRMPGTLNSKSGLTKLRCNDLESFKPLDEACMLGDKEISVEMKTPIKMMLKGQLFKINEHITRLPAYAAIYLVCKRLAIII
jgi:DNA primase small subunit